MSDLILPTEEQVERAARALCAAAGQNPDKNFAGWQGGERWRLKDFTDPARQFLVLLLNKDKILEAPYAYTPPNYPEVVRKAIEENPDASPERLLGSIMKEQHGKTDPNAVRAEIFRQRQSPIALTEDHIPSLERAIRAEGYDIKVDTDTGEVKLYKE